jgi:hypothetical protein
MMQMLHTQFQHIFRVHILEKGLYFAMNAGKPMLLPSHQVEGEI